MKCIFCKTARTSWESNLIETALEQLNTSYTTIVVGEDINLLIILTARTPTDKIIYFLKPGKAQAVTKIQGEPKVLSYFKKLIIKN